MINVALSFDDGREDNYRIAEEILKPLQIPATFNITTAYILERSKIKPCNNIPLSKRQVVMLSECPLFEIAGHGYEHHNNTKNLILSVSNLRDWCLSAEITGIASPNSKINKESIKTNLQTYKRNNIRYIRIGDRIETYVFVKKWVRRLNRIFKSPKLFYWVYKETLLEKSDNYILYSIPILKDINIAEIIYLIEKAIYEERSVILMFHSVVKRGEDHHRDRWSWDYDRFLKLCKRLKYYEKQGLLRLSRTIEIVSEESEC